MSATKRYIIYNGELQQWQPSEEVYLYQNIHTLAYRAWHLKEHLEILTYSAQTLFGLNISLSQQAIAKQIEVLLDTLRLSRNVSICVVMRLYATGDYSLHVEQVSIYSGYVLRSLRPIVQCVKMDVALNTYPSSALQASYALAHKIALSKCYHQAIMINSAGYVVEDPLHPVATIKEYTISIPRPTVCSVECMLLERAAERRNLNVEYREISLLDITDADEVLIMTYQGITSVAQINNKHYFTSLADKIASELSRETFSE